MQYKVYFYTTSWGRCYIKEYLDQIHSNKELHGIALAKLDRMKNPMNHRPPLVKAIVGRKHKYSEIRPGGKNTARLIFLTAAGYIVVVFCGFTKKGRALKPNELSKADDIVGDYLSGKGSCEEHEI